MSRMRNMDIGPVHEANGWLPPPSLPVCKQSQVLDRREDHWPFLFSYKQDGSVVVNRGTAQTAYASAQEIGEALL